jgi:hypothetical protein
MSASEKFVYETPAELATEIDRLRAEVAAYEAAFAEIRMIPSWKDPVFPGMGGFDVDGDEWAIIQRILAERPEAHLNQFLEEAWSAGHMQAIANIAWPNERKGNPWKQVAS